MQRVGTKEERSSNKAAAEIVQNLKATGSVVTVALRSRAFRLLRATPPICFVLTVTSRKKEAEKQKGM
jgi:hypothetical protein